MRVGFVSLVSLGQCATWRHLLTTSGLPPNPDVNRRKQYVRFVQILLQKSAVEERGR